MEITYVRFEKRVLKRSGRTHHSTLQYLGIGYSISGANLVHMH
jgi:uncharacterized membrane protein